MQQMQHANQEAREQMRRDQMENMNYLSQRLETMAHEQKEQKYEMDAQKYDMKSKATGLKESTESVGIQDRVASSTATTNLQLVLVQKTKKRIFACLPVQVWEVE